MQVVELFTIYTFDNLACRNVARDSIHLKETLRQSRRRMEYLTWHRDYEWLWQCGFDNIFKDLFSLEGFIKNIASQCGLHKFVTLPKIASWLNPHQSSQTLSFLCTRNETHETRSYIICMRYLCLTLVMSYFALAFYFLTTSAKEGQTFFL